jgi:hypothetical protein
VDYFPKFLTLSEKTIGHLREAHSWARVAAGELIGHPWSLMVAVVTRIAIFSTFRMMSCLLAASYDDERCLRIWVIFRRRSLLQS